MVLNFLDPLIEDLVEVELRRDVEFSFDLRPEIYPIREEVWGEFKGCLRLLLSPLLGSLCSSVEAD